MRLSSIVAALHLSLATSTCSFGVSLFIVTSGHAQTAATNSARGVSARLETDRAVYQVGQPIRVRITLTNTSGHNLSYVSAGPAGLTKLIVYDPMEQRIKPTLSEVGKRASGPMRTWMPQQELRVIAKGQGEWVDVSAWGYDLRSSGNYRIVGMPAVGDPDAKFDVKALNSDEGKEGIAITIER